MKVLLVLKLPAKCLMAVAMRACTILHCGKGKVAHLSCDHETPETWFKETLQKLERCLEQRRTVGLKTF